MDNQVQFSKEQIFDFVLSSLLLAKNSKCYQIVQFVRQRLRLHKYTPVDRMFKLKRVASRIRSKVQVVRYRRLGKYINRRGFRGLFCKELRDFCKELRDITAQICEI